MCSQTLNMLYTLFSGIFFIILTYLCKNISSNKPNKIKFHLKFCIFYFTSSVFAAILWPFFLLRPKDIRNCNLGVRIVSQIVRRIYDLKFVLRNGEILSEDRGAVVVSNHQSSLDILGMFTIWDTAGKIAAIAKKQLLYVFPFGFAAWLAGVVFIDRNNPKAAYKQLQATSDVMIQQKAKIWLFPEGTRNKDYTKLLPFKKGAFAIAVAAQVPIIPVVYSPYYFINAQKYVFNKGHIIMQVLEPIPTKGLTMDDIPNLIEKVHEKMSTTYKELSKEVINDLPSNYPYTNVG